MWPAAPLLKASTSNNVSINSSFGCLAIDWRINTCFPATSPFSWTRVSPSGNRTIDTGKRGIPTCLLKFSASSGCDEPAINTDALLKQVPLSQSIWGGRIRTSAWRYQKPLPYHLATPQKNEAYSVLNLHIFSQYEF